MCGLFQAPKIQKQNSPPPVEPPKIELGDDKLRGEQLRRRQRTGRNQLRTDLNTSSAGSGLAIPR